MEEEEVGWPELGKEGVAAFINEIKKKGMRRQSDVKEGGDGRRSYVKGKGEQGRPGGWVLRKRV